MMTPAVTNLSQKKNLISNSWKLCCCLPHDQTRARFNSLQPKHKQCVYVCYFGIQRCSVSLPWPPACCVSVNLFVHHIHSWSLCWHCGQTHNTARMTLIITTADPCPHPCHSVCFRARLCVRVLSEYYVIFPNNFTSLLRADNNRGYVVLVVEQDYAVSIWSVSLQYYMDIAWILQSQRRHLRQVGDLQTPIFYALGLLNSALHQDLHFYHFYSQEIQHGVGALSWRSLSSHHSLNLLCQSTSSSRQI